MGANPTLLEHPPWSALTTTHAPFALGNELARRYRSEVAAMAGLREGSKECVQALQAIMQPGDVVGLFSAEPVDVDGVLHMIVRKPLEQMIYHGEPAAPADLRYDILGAADVPEMMALVKLTEPGPFAARTVELGTYIGLRSGGQLIAMAGERMRFPGFTEVSAVCTHPDHRGRGHASALVRTLLRAIKDRGETPFLHIFGDNVRARALYQELGFALSRGLFVTVLKRES